MLFGDTLHDMLDYTGLKSTHLARELGYDVSYISRWINNEKLPSMKNNSDLFHQIGRFFVDNADEQGFRMISDRLGLNELSELSYEEKEKTIASFLNEIYNAQKASLENGGISGRDGNNCLLSRYVEPEQILTEIRRSLSQLKDKQENIIVYNTIIDYLRDNIGILHEILKLVEDANRRLVVIQIVDMERMKKNLDMFCQAVVYSMMDTNRFMVKMYEGSFRDESNVEMLVVRECLMMRKLTDPFTNGRFYLISNEMSVIRDYYFGMRNSVQNKNPLVEKITSAELGKENYFVNYLFQWGFRHILTVMHLLYAEQDTLDAILEEQGTYDKNPSFKIGMFNAEKSVVIFKKPILQYIYEGDINLQGGDVAKISIKLRIRHLTDIINRLKSFSGFKLTIIEDTNPVLNYAPGMPSIYLGNRTGHATSYTTIDDSYIFRSLELIYLFREYHKKLENLADSFAMRGQDVIDFLSNSINFLKLLDKKEQ